MFRHSTLDSRPVCHYNQRMKPIIGISVSDIHTESSQAIADLVREMGAEPFVISDHANHNPHSDVERTTAWILMGNDWDIDPTDYIDRYPDGSAKRKIHGSTKSELCYSKGRARAHYEKTLIPIAISRDTPLMGVCGGMQRINVQLGGTLHQHLPDFVGDDRHCQKTRGIDFRTAEIPILIEAGTTLADIACDVDMPFVRHCSKDEPKVIYENSVHHQAIDYVAEGLRRCCVTDAVSKKTGKSGYIIKGIEVDPAGKYAGKFILGLQWHPEFCASELGPRILTRLIQQAEFYQYGNI